MTFILVICDGTNLLSLQECFGLDSVHLIVIELLLIDETAIGPRAEWPFIFLTSNIFDVRRDLGLQSKTWLFNNPSDVVPAIPAYSWMQVESPVFNPANKNPKMCPFNGAIPPASKTRGRKATRNFITNAFERSEQQIKWEHSIQRYVWQLGKACVDNSDPLWHFVWPSGNPPNVLVPKRS